MDRYKTIQIICWLVVAVAFLGLAVWLFLGMRRGFRFGFSLNNVQALNGAFEEEGRYSIDTTNIDDLDINWISGGVKVIPYDGSSIEIVEYAQRNLKEDELLVYEISGSTLDIRYCERDSFIFHSIPSKKLEIMLPTSMAGNLQEFSLKTTSASMQVSDITAKSINVTSVSGDGELTNITSDDFLLKTTSGTFVLSEVSSSKASMRSVSGELAARNIEFDNLDMQTTSGNVLLENTTTRQLSCHCVSGDLRYSGSFEELSGETTSGKFIIIDEITPKEFHLRSVSGDIHLTMPEPEDFVLYHKSVSGDLESEIPMKTSKSEKEPYSIKTTSGDVTIRMFDTDIAD